MVTVKLKYFPKLYKALGGTQQVTTGTSLRAQN